MSVSYRDINIPTSSVCRDGFVSASDIKPENEQQPDFVVHIPELQRAGKTVAKKVKAVHFTGF